MNNANWNEFGKDMSELATKNLEIMNKFFKTATGRNDEVISKNMDSYFDYLNANIDCLNTIWMNNKKSGDEFRETFRAQTGELYSRFTKIYRETAQAATQKQEN